MPWSETAKTEYTRPRARFESDLTDEEWILVEPRLPPLAKRGRPRKTDLREVFNATQRMRDAGCRWRAILPCFPPAATVQQYFHLRRDGGVFARMMDGLRVLGRELAGRSATPTAAATDTQLAETTESVGPSGCDAGKKAEGRKRHFVVDVEGLPIETAVADLRQGRRRERNITVETRKGSRLSTAGGSSSGPSLGCRAAGAWRKTASGAWRALWHGRSWSRAAS